MFSGERHDRIMEELTRKPSITVRELSEMLYISEATARRDLASLERRGLVDRVYGGAVIKRFTFDVPLAAREGEQAAEKNLIAREAVKVVKENDVIFMDASSTVHSMVKYLGEFRNLLVVTNGLRTALALSDMHIRTFCTGGALIDNSYSFIGQHAIDMVQSVRADVMFFSCRGISSSGQLTDTSVEEDVLRQMMMRRANKCVLLATANKIGKDYFHQFGQIEDVDMVLTEKPLPNGWRARIGRNRSIALNRAQQP